MKLITHSPSAETVREKTPRLFAIDSAKGIGILLVVFGHAWRGLMGAGLVPDGPLFRTVDFAVYAFHMPLFFFLSGLLFLDALRKHAAGTLFRGRVTRLLWPMALWSWMFFGLKLVAGANANAPVTTADFPLVPLPPYEHLWFLWALFLCQILLIFFYALLGGRLTTSAIQVGAGALAIALAVVNPLMSVPSPIWGPMVQHMPYFLAGIAVGGVTYWQPTLRIGVLAGAGFAAMIALLGPEKASVVWSLVLVMLGWMVWLYVDRSAVVTGPVLNALRYLGQGSMVIYLAHTAFSAALRIALIKVGLEDLSLLLILTVAIGVFGPLLVLSVARKLRLTRILGF